jgi:o-succinylbenzoate synthase
MRLHVEVRPYCRSFARPLTTAAGVLPTQVARTWRERRGFLIRITDGDGAHGYGEVAPVPWLGSETLEEAGDFLRAFQSGSAQGVSSRISRLSACRFGIDSAMSELRHETSEWPIRPLAVAALLPAGRPALEVMKERAREGFQTFKWKIGVEEGEVEREIFRELTAAAPPEARMRLDANAGLSLAEARAWLTLLDEMGAEYLEQPLPVGQFDEMVALSRSFATPIALDESVGGARQFEDAHRRKWPGLYVIKPALFGAMREGVGLLPPLRPRLIISSVFETSIGFEGALRWASRWQAEGAAGGLGTNDFMEKDGFYLHPTGPKVIRGLVDLARVWERAAEDEGEWLPHKSRE